MLVLERKTDERVIIRDVDGNLLGDVMICKIDFARNQVKLGFRGPKTTRFLREELDQQDQQNKAGAVTPGRT